MREVYKEEVIAHLRYSAVDGTEFDDKEECEKYEASAKGVLMGKFMNLVVAKTNEYDLLRGDNENEVFAVKINTEKQKDVVLQLYYLQHPYLLKDDYKEYKERFDNLVEETYACKDILLLGINCENDLYYIDRVQNIIERLNVLCKNDSKTTD